MASTISRIHYRSLGQPIYVCTCFCFLCAGEPRSNLLFGITRCYVFTVSTGAKHNHTPTKLTYKHTHALAVFAPLTHTHSCAVHWSRERVRWASARTRAPVHSLTHSPVNQAASQPPFAERWSSESMIATIHFFPFSVYKFVHSSNIWNFFVFLSSCLHHKAKKQRQQENSNKYIFVSSLFSTISKDFKQILQNEIADSM